MDVSCQISIFTAGYSNKTVEDIKEAFHVDQFVSHTDVEFDDLSPQVIRAYIETGEPMYVFDSDYFKLLSLDSVLLLCCSLVNNLFDLFTVFRKTG